MPLVDPIKRAMQWRKDNAALIKLVHEGGDHPPHFEVINKFVATALHKTKVDDGPVFIVRSGLSNPKLHMDTYVCLRVWRPAQVKRATVVIAWFIGPVVALTAALTCLLYAAG